MASRHGEQRGVGIFFLRTLWPVIVRMSVPSNVRHERIVPSTDPAETDTELVS